MNVASLETVHTGRLDPLMNIQQVTKVTTLCRSTIYDKIKEGTFPPPGTFLGTSRKAWRESTIADWINRNFVEPDIEPVPE